MNPSTKSFVSVKRCSSVLQPSITITKSYTTPFTYTTFLEHRQFPAVAVSPVFIPMYPSFNRILVLSHSIGEPSSY